MRKLKYRLTDEQFGRILKANTPTPLILLQCGMPPTVAQRVNAVWDAIGKEKGFDPNTVEPDGDMEKDFRAVPVQKGQSRGRA